MLGSLTPATAVDYVELREQRWIPAGADAGAASGVTAAATQGTACATATDRDACLTALAALALVDNQSGWLTNGDTSGDIIHTLPATKQFLVYTRGDTVGAVYSSKEIASFLGSIDSLEEARLVLQTRNQPLTCTTNPRPSGWRGNDDGSWELLIAGTSCGTLIRYRNRYVVANHCTVTTLAGERFPSGAVCGRRPEGLFDEHVAHGSAHDLATHFVEAAYLEAASVIAFRRLELELLAHGAPDSLVTRARRARVEEIHHARETAHLARRHGGVVPPVEVAAIVRRDRFAIALENTVEGCVRETYGALVAGFQAERAAPELRPLFRRIAADEARHAELAHDVARWLDRKLSPAERATIAHARGRALAELFDAVAREPAADVVRIAGMPSSTEARILLEGLEGAFFAAA